MNKADKVYNKRREELEASIVETIRNIGEYEDRLAEYKGRARRTNLYVEDLSWEIGCTQDQLVDSKEYLEELKINLAKLVRDYIYQPVWRFYKIPTTDEPKLVWQYQTPTKILIYIQHADNDWHWMMYLPNGKRMGIKRGVYPENVNQSWMRQELATRYNELKEQ